MTLGGSLTGCVVLITSDRRSAELRAACEHRGAEVVHAPALSHTAHFADDHLARATRQLVARPADTVVLTTGSGFLGWLEAADAIGLETELLASLRGARIIARGQSAHGAAVGVGLDVDPGMVPESATGARDLLLTDGVRGRRVAVQHQGAVSEALDADLAMAGADVVSLVAHPWGPAPDPVAVTLSVQEAAVGNIDAALFTSAPAACAWVDAAREADVLASISARATAGTLTVMAVGPVTARPLLEAGITPLQPEQPRLGALVRSLVEHYEGVGTSSVQTPAGSLLVRNTVAVLNGRAIPVSRGCLGVLRLLAQAKGSVVTRAQVLEVLPGGSGNGHAVEVAVARLREALGDPQLVETVVKRGYRLALA